MMHVCGSWRNLTSRNLNRSHAVSVAVRHEMVLRPEFDLRYEQTDLQAADNHVARLIGVGDPGVISPASETHFRANPPPTQAALQGAAVPTMRHGTARAPESLVHASEATCCTARCDSTSSPLPTPSSDVGPGPPSAAAPCTGAGVTQTRDPYDRAIIELLCSPLRSWQYGPMACPVFHITQADDFCFVPATRFTAVSNDISTYRCSSGCLGFLSLRGGGVSMAGT